MSDAEVARSFLTGQVEALEPFGFLILGAAARPIHVVEAARLEDGSFEVRVPGRPPGFPELEAASKSKLEDSGFHSEDAANPSLAWMRPCATPKEAIDGLLSVMQEVFGEPSDLAINIAQGSRRAEHEAQQRLAAVRERIEKVIPDLVSTEVVRDADGDYLLPIQDVHVTIAPRIAPGGGIVVRIIAISNVGVNVTPELGLLLANLNFGLMFGRFALDAANRAIWVDESLLGDHFSDDELRFSVHAVAGVADEWDDRLKQMFGGTTHQEIITKQLEGPVPAHKPGQGLYL